MEKNLLDIIAQSGIVGAGGAVFVNENIAFHFGMLCTQTQEGCKYMREKLAFIIGRIKAGRLQEMWRQTKWIYVYAKRHWLAMIFYTVLGLSGTLVSLIGSLVSKDMVDIMPRMFQKVSFPIYIKRSLITHIQCEGFVQQIAMGILTLQKSRL